jgi:hypothetical protein
MNARPGRGLPLTETREGAIPSPESDFVRIALLLVLPFIALVFERTRVRPTFATTEETV